MTNDNTPNLAELRGAAYLDRACALMVEDGLSPDEAFRVVILHALSKVAAKIGSDDPTALAAWLRAEADAIDLHDSPPAGAA